MEDIKEDAKITRKNATIVVIIVAVGLIAAIYIMQSINEKKVTFEKKDNVLDTDGNIYTSEKMLDGKHWMTQNLNIAVTDSYCYENIEANCSRYGRLYTWEAAKNACNRLGNGWRLPTYQEWRKMANYYGGIRSDSEIDGKAAYKALIVEGDSEFNALLSGNRSSNGIYLRLDAHGFYWSATEHNDGAWFINFANGAQFVNSHNDGDKLMACSVRCVKEIEILLEN